VFDYYEGKMNWRYDNPIGEGQYLCCVIGYRYPVVTDWHDGAWGKWYTGREKKWVPLDEEQVLCYIGFDEIPMPEGW
jgi:hypothetical protein